MKTSLNTEQIIVNSPITDTKSLLNQLAFNMATKSFMFKNNDRVTEEEGKAAKLHL
jgi:hypothetical protein